MKKIVLLISFILLAMSMSAQVYYKFQGGLNISDYTMDGEGPRIGYKVGGGVGYMASDNFLAEGSLMLTTKGTKGNGVSIEQRYIQIPINIGIRFDVSDNFYLLWTFGVYAAYGFDGKTKWTEGRTGWTTPTFSHDNYWGRALSRYDYGAQTGLALDFGRFLCGLDFEMGAAPLIRHKYRRHHHDDDKMLNMTLAVSFAVRFGDF